MTNNIVSKNIEESGDMISQNFCAASASYSIDDDFDGFLQKSIANQFSGSLCVKNFPSIFPALKSYNLLRNCCLRMNTESPMVELPESFGFGLSTDANQNIDYKSVKILLTDMYVKWKIPRNLFKQSNYSAYLKNILSNELAAIERKLFVNGKAGIFDGIIKSLVASKRLFKLDFSDSSILKDLSVLRSNVEGRYLQNSVYLMSSKKLSVLSALLIKDSKFVGESLTEIFGNKILIMDELNDHVLFGDFSQSVVMVERGGSKIEMHSNFENPSQIGLSLPISVGFGIINKLAIAIGGPDFSNDLSLENAFPQLPEN